MPGAAPPPPPATRTLSVVLRDALAKGEDVRLIVAKALADSVLALPNAAAYMNVELEGQSVTIPKLAGAALGGTASGYAVYVLATKDFMLAVGTVAAAGGATSGGVIPIGGILQWPTATPPSGWLACDGSAFSAVTYPLLAAVLGGTTLPDLKRRVPVGAGAGFAVGSNDGQAEGNRHVLHHHTFSGGGSGSGSTDTQGNHNHGAAGTHRHGTPTGEAFAMSIGNTGTRGTAPTTFNLVSGWQYETGDAGSHTHGDAGAHTHGVSVSVSVSGNTSGGTPTDGPSFIVLNFIIRAL